MPTPLPADPPPASRFSLRRLDPFLVLLVLVLLLFYGGYLLPRCLRYQFLTWDAYRDLIAARHLLAGGRLIDDPVLKGYFCWYPPLHAALCSCFIFLTGMDVFRFYALTPVFLNWIFPLVFYLFFRRLLDHDRPAACITTLSLVLMPWAVTYVFASPVVMAHATAFALLLLYAYSHLPLAFTRCALAWSAALGFMGLYHPPTFLILLASVLLHRLLLAWRAKTPSLLIRWLLPCGLVAAFFSSPYGILNLLESIHNSEPLRYIAPGLSHWEIVLPGTSWLRFFPWVILAAIGFYTGVWQRRDALSWLLLSLFVVSLLGQIPAYLVLWLGDASSWIAYLPVLLPHEFQLYSQLCLCGFAGLGLHRLLPNALKPFRLAPWLLLLPALISLVLSLAEFPSRSQVFLQPHRLAGEWTEPVRFIRSHTGVYDVFCTPDDWSAFFVIGAQTGRKCLETYPSHMNPHANAASRESARQRLYTSASLEEITRLRDAFSLDYLLATVPSVPSERLQFFQNALKCVYDDGTVYIFQLDPAQNDEGQNHDRTINENHL